MYFTRRQILDMGLSAASLDRWSKVFRGTPLVVKPPRQHLLYSADFVTFLRQRTLQVGPGNLPASPVIVTLYTGVREGKPLRQLAQELGVPLVVAQEWAKQLGITEVKHER